MWVNTAHAYNETYFHAIEFLNTYIVNMIKVLWLIAWIAFGLF